jgi:nucleoside-diphosphate-sugar epimerase
MIRCLIGYSGFVGGNISRQSYFEEEYNSRNIQEIKGKNFDEIYCTGVSAAKWYANQHPKEDWQGIQRLLDPLRQVKAGRFVLISTVDVYKTPVEVDEDTPIELEGHHPYGKHRRLVEMFVEDYFPDHCIIRLPGLFGVGLKKNAIYDLLHQHQMEKIHADAVFQFYNLDHLYQDIQVAINCTVPLINFATPPLSIREIAEYAFGLDFTNRPSPHPPRYNMKTKYGSLYGSMLPYITTRQQVLDQLQKYVESQRSGGRV